MNSTDAAVPARTSLRVAGTVIAPSEDSGVIAQGHPWGAALWEVIRLCAAAEQRARVATSNIPSVALQSAELFFTEADLPILDTLTTRFPELVGGLEVLRITHNRHDEGPSLAAFAALATHLKALTFEHCGLTSVAGLRGRCEQLKILELDGCDQLGSLAGLEDHPRLEEVCACGSAIPSLEPLRTCPALGAAVVDGCEQLGSLDGLEGHAQLLVARASGTAIASVQPLRSCPVLTIVGVSECSQLRSLEGLEDHEQLQQLDASGTAIASVQPLRTCPALATVALNDCQQLCSLDGLEDHVELEVVFAADTAVTSVVPLLTCPALALVVLDGCAELRDLRRLHDHHPALQISALSTSSSHSPTCCGGGGHSHE